MKPNQTVKKIELLLSRTAWLVLWAALVGTTAIQPMEAATNVVVWDARSRFNDTPDAVNRAGWKAVPSELFVFEADPPKAASDPGYYGREYSVKGDAVVENHSLAALFCSAKGRVIFYSK